ncbi:MAG: hypothetical protein JAY66_16630, partial [Candidatus Thiodiazotropha taylori]|nr:hypothetical protein [Candidatus Thiodiazotropha taylori]
MAKYGKGVRSTLYAETSYIKVYDSFVQQCEERYGLNLIARLHNTPGMPCSEDINIAFIEQCVVVVAIAKQFSCSVDASKPPLGLGQVLEHVHFPAPPTDVVHESDSVVSSVFDPASSSSVPVPLISPCSDIGSPVFKQPSRACKRRPVIESEDDSPATVAVKHRLVVGSDDESVSPSPMSSAPALIDEAATGVDISDLSDDAAESDRMRRNKMAKVLEENNLHIGLNIKKSLRANNEYIKVLEKALSAEQRSKEHINNVVGNAINLMKFFATGNDPRQFSLKDLTNTDKLPELSSVLTKAGCKGETKSKYFQSLKIFIEKLRNSNYRKTQSGLMADLHFTEEQASDLQKLTRIQKKQDKMDKLAEMSSKEDQSARGLIAFREAVDRLEVEARVVIKRVRQSPSGPTSSDVLIVNMFFLGVTVKFGHRPVVFRNMLFRRNREAREAEPVQVGELGLFRMLISSKHKTGPSNLAYVPIKDPEHFDILCDYVRHIRLKPATEADKNLLFLNSLGSAVRNPTESLKSVVSRLKLKVGTATEVRHFNQTLAHNRLEGKDKEDVSTFLCHKPETARAHYVDSFLSSAKKGVLCVETMLVPEGKTSAAEINSLLCPTIWME